MPTNIDNVILNKAGIIERSLNRMKEEFRANPKLDNYTHIDAMLLNIERACQAAIDSALHLVTAHRLGIPQTSAEAFILLQKANFISEKTSRSMVGMTGFRNVAIHEYQNLEMDILRAIVEKEYLSIVSYCQEIGIAINLDKSLENN